MVTPSKRDFVIRTQLDTANASNQASLSPSNFVLGIHTINTTAHSIGSNVVLSTTSLFVGNSTTNASIFSTAITLANSTSTTSLRVPTPAEASGNYFLHANGSWINPAVVPAVGTANRVYQKHSATADQTTFVLTGGFEVVDVYYNGTHLANDEFSAATPNVTLVDPADAGAIVELVGWKGAVILLTAQGSNTEIQFNDSGMLGGNSNLRWQNPISKLTVGSTTENVSSNANFLQIANSTASINVIAFGITGGNSTSNIVANTSFIRVANSTGGANITPASILVTNALANVTITPYSVQLGNSTVNSTIDLTGVLVANSTTSVTANLTTIRVANTLASANVTAGVLQVGNSTVFTTIGQTGISHAGSNTLNLGSGSFLKAANGYTFLPNGLLLQWGVVAANGSGAAGNLTFPIAFPTAIYSYSAVSETANAAYVLTATTTTMNVRITSGGGPQGVNCHWMAIGS